MKGLMALVFTCFSLVSYAGNGSSGGGNVYGDSVNPWFFQNTKNVTYCIDIGADFSSLGINEIRPLINEAINYWKKEFKSKEDYSSSDFKPALRIATQNFKEVGCDVTNVDVRFQLGILTEAQNKKIANRGQIIGLAYRETYDQVNLKGSGFIYIAAEKGEYRPESTRFASNAWSAGNNRVLLAALIHELGHVFGLQDLAFDSTQTLMGTQFVETITSSVYVTGFSVWWTPDDSQPLGFDGKAYGSMGLAFSGGLDQSFCEFLGLNFYGNCDVNSFHLEANGKTIDLSIATEVGQKVFVGTFDLQTGKKSNDDLMNMSNVWLTKKQKVFKVDSRLLDTYQPAYDLAWSGNLSNVEYKTRLGSIKREVFVNFISSGNYRIGGVINGKFYPDIFSMEF